LKGENVVVPNRFAIAAAAAAAAAVASAGDPPSGFAVVSLAIETGSDGTGFEGRDAEARAPTGLAGSPEAEVAAGSTFFGREEEAEVGAVELGRRGEPGFGVAVFELAAAASSAFFFFQASSFSRLSRFFSSSAAAATAESVVAVLEFGRGEAEPDTV
jgi:hypothetical protein